MIGKRRALGMTALMLALVATTGCAHHRWSPLGFCGSDDCECESDCESDGCRPGCCGGCHHGMCCSTLACCHRRSNAIPETLPLGSTVRTHYQLMETNGEAADFIVYRHNFVGQTAELTSDGKDHILEIAARMPSTPFPVLVERSENNADPELDAHRRNLVAQVLTDLGNHDAQQRTIVSTSYGPGYNAIQAVPMYYRHVGTRGAAGNFGTFGNNFGAFGGFGGGAGGGIGFGP